MSPHTRNRSPDPATRGPLKAPDKKIGWALSDMIGWKVIPRIGIGPVQFSPHGVGIAFGCFVGAWLMARRARARGFDENHAWNTAAWGVVGAIIGARLAYVIGHLDSYSSPLQWLEIWKGGISLIGGLIGGVIFASLYFRRHHLDF